MKKFILLISAVIFSFGVISESRAETCTDGYASITCLSGIDSLCKTETEEYICGTDCTFTIVGDTVKVKANSKNATISDGIFSPMGYSGGKVVKTNGEEVNFNKIELDGDFASIGTFAFNHTKATIIPKSGTLKISSPAHKIANVSTIQGDVYVEKAGGDTLQNANIKGNLIFADGIKTIGGWFMGRAKIDGDVIIPASVTDIARANWITILDSLEEGHKVYCGAGNCYQLFYDSCYKDTREDILSECLSALERLNDNGKLASYPDGCASINASLDCTKCKNSNFKLNDGECDRLRWTPAEAAEVLKDDNTNSVTITFKK